MDDAKLEYRNNYYILYLLILKGNILNLGKRQRFKRLNVTGLGK